MTGHPTTATLDAPTLPDEAEATRTSAEPALAASAGQATAKPIRVLFIDHTACMGGGEIALLNLVKNLDAVRFEPAVLLFSDGPLADHLRAASISTHILPLPGNVLNTRKDSLGLATLLRVSIVLRVILHAFRVARFICRHKADLVHTNSLKADIIGGLAARLSLCKVIWHVRDRIDRDYLPKPVVEAFRLLSRWLPNYVIANSQSTLQTLRLPESQRGAAVYSGIDVLSRLHIVHDGTDPVAFAAVDAKPKANPLLGLVGRISPWKGQHVFLRAAAEVRKRFPQARFQIIGSAMFAEQAYEKEVRELCQSLGLVHVVEFTGFRPDVPELVSKLDVLVHASTSGEPFGQVVVEGMAAGKPVVATNGGGVPEIVVDGVTGLLVPMGEHLPMAAAMCRLLDDPRIAARMGQLGRQRVVEHFTIDHTTRRIEDIYEALVRPLPSFGARVAGRVRSAAMPIALVLVTAFLALLGKLALMKYTGAPHPTTFATFFAAIIVSVWFRGLAAGLASLAINTLLIVYFILPPIGFHVDSAELPRLILFCAVALTIVLLISKLQVANRRARAALERAEAAYRRADFLTRATVTFATSMDEGEVLSHLVYLANGELSDWCTVDLVQADGSICRAAGAHADPSLNAVVAGLAVWPNVANGSALRSATPRIERTLGGEEFPLELGQANCSTRIAVPLISLGSAVGLLTLIRGCADPYDQDELGIAVELATRASMALSGARHSGKRLKISRETGAYS